MPLVSEFLERLDRDEAKTRFMNYCFIMRDTLQDRKLEQGFKAGQKRRGGGHHGHGGKRGRR